MPLLRAAHKLDARFRRLHQAAIHGKIVERHAACREAGLELPADGDPVKRRKAINHGDGAGLIFDDQTGEADVDDLRDRPSIVGEDGRAAGHADGQLAEGYIALAEVQGYVFAGKRLAARCARRLGLNDRAANLESAAVLLAERFEEAFWCEELGTYALALDGAKQPCKVRTSNAGQLLFTGIVGTDRARRVAADLMSPKFFSGWGIRTVALGEVRYNPMSYHDGSIWPHDNALIALGLARYGLKHSVAHLFKGLFDAASYMSLV